jgi:hypothetical protein
MSEETAETLSEAAKAARIKKANEALDMQVASFLRVTKGKSKTFKRGMVNKRAAKLNWPDVLKQEFLKRADLL